MTADNATLVDEFCEHQRTYRQISAQRIRTARFVLAWITEDGTDLTSPDAAKRLLAVLARELDAGRHPNTARKYLMVAKSFYGWGFDNNYIGAETYMRVKRLRTPAGSSNHSTPKPYSRTEIASLWRELAERYPRSTAKQTEARLAHFHAGRYTFRPLRAEGNRLMLECLVALALDMGLRRAEIFQLSLDDIHYDNEYVVVLGKGRKTREVPFSTRARAAAQEWIEFRTRLNPDHDNPWLSMFFLETALAPLSWDAFETLLKLRIGPTWRWHRLRHTCATERLRAGMPLEAVSRMLGHATLQQTLMYAEIARPDVKAKMDSSEARFDAAVRAAA